MKIFELAETYQKRLSELLECPTNHVLIFTGLGEFLQRQ